MVQLFLFMWPWTSIFNFQNTCLKNLCTAHLLVPLDYNYQYIKSYCDHSLIYLLSSKEETKKLRKEAVKNGQPYFPDDR